jgi:hypothetical protein
LAARCPCPPVPADSKVGLPGPARGQQRAARGPNFSEESDFFVVKKIEIQILIEKIYRLWIFSLT